MRRFYHAVDDLVVGHSDDPLIAEYQVEGLFDIGAGRSGGKGFYGDGEGMGNSFILLRV